MLRPFAMDPHFFVDQGVKDRLFIDDLLKGSAGAPTQGVESGIGAYMLLRLANFRQGGPWDAQRLATEEPDPRYVDYATVAIGLYGAAAGIPKDSMLFIEDFFAMFKSKFGNVPRDEHYTHLAKRNVANTELGYQLYQSGRIGPEFKP